MKGYEKHDLVKCRDCGFVFMRQIPTPDELEKHYAGYVYKHDQYISPLTLKVYDKLLDEFEKYRNTNRLLDIGCGVGFLLEQAKKRGWDIYGTEYSQKAIDICRDKGIEMKKGSIDSSTFNKKDFDVIISIEVIEHLNNPNREIEEIKKLLRNGGLFYCTTPNFNSLNRYYLKDKYNIIGYPEHLTYYTKKTLNKLMTKHGFKKKKLLSTGISISRYKASLKLSDENRVPGQSDDEKLRNEIARKWYLGIAKNIANKLFTITGTGMALKGYFENFN
jgi:2-polyprenyl-3-methyl-5-hydroxy-6-metoxy-1,4-benzoquinol methylase